MASLTVWRRDQLSRAVGSCAQGRIAHFTRRAGCGLRRHGAADLARTYPSTHGKEFLCATVFGMGRAGSSC